MATVTAASISVSDSLERFRQEFNTLRSDVSNITSGTITINNESNNRILTSVSENTFNAEAGLTYDGSTFAVSGAVTISGLTIDKKIKKNDPNFGKHFFCSYCKLL